MKAETVEVRAYDHSGNKVVSIDARVGDEVSYKKDGVAGSYRGFILGWKKRIKVKLIDHNGVPFSEPIIRHVAPYFLSVYRNGIRLP